MEPNTNVASPAPRRFEGRIRADFTPNQAQNLFTILANEMPPGDWLEFLADLRAAWLCSRAPKELSRRELARLSRALDRLAWSLMQACETHQVA